MIVGNIKSAKDLSDKKELQKQLLELEASNESVRQQRVKETGLRNLEPQKLPEQYKTASEIQKDRMSLEKKAQDNFAELGFNYTDAGQLVNWISNQNKLGAFNAGFKEIKKDLTEKYEPSLINEQFIKNYLVNYFDELEVNLGKKFGKETAEGGITDLYGVEEAYAGSDIIDAINQQLIEIISLNRTISRAVLQIPNLPLTNTLEGKIGVAIDLLNKCKSLIPDREFFNDSVSSFSQNERMKLVKTLDRAFRISKVPTRRELAEIEMGVRDFSQDLKNAIGGGYRTPESKRFAKVIDRLIRQLSNISDPKTGNAFSNFYNEIDRTINTTGEYTKLSQQLEDKQKEIQKAFSQPVNLEYFEKVAGVADVLDEYSASAQGRNDEGKPLADLELYVEVGLEEQKEAYNREAKKKSDEAEAKLRGKKSEELESLNTALKDKFANALRQRNKGETRAYLNELLNEMRQIEQPTKRKGAYRFLALLIRQKYQPVLNADEIERLDKIYKKSNSSVADKDIEYIETILDIASNDYGDLNIDYNPSKENTPLDYKYDNRNYNLTDNAGRVFGIGARPKLLSKLKKHFKGDEQLLKKVVSALESDSSSDEDTAKELQRHQNATRKVDKKLEKLVRGKGDPFGDWISKNITRPAIEPILDHFNPNKGRGVDFKATRIPVGKVGKGVKLEKEDNPTYRQFGKYVIHIPYLLNSNIANFKYPSLGSIPSIKPLTISDDYKDLLLETLQTGKLNKKELERLPQSEIKHFEKVAVGAGLVEQLGMKVGITE